MVRHWRDRRNAVIFISHRMAEVADLCDRATVLRDGVTVGVTERAHGSEERIVALLGAETAGSSAASASKLSEPRATPSDRQAALEVHGLSSGPLLNDVSFKLHAGEVLGVAALEGQGQEELFDCIAGNRRYDEGAILANGKKLRLRHPADAIREGIVLVPANRLLALMQQRSIRENIALPAFGRLSSWGPIGMRRESARVDSTTERLQIDTRASSELRRLSGGNQQKVVIARWLAAGFNTLLCFDPTRGIDVGTKRQIYALVRELAAAGSAVLLFTSELPEMLVNYVMCSLLAAVAGLVIVGSVDAADLSLADVFLLPSIAAVSIGGTSIFGGGGGYTGAIIGALILTVLNSMLTLLDAPEPIRQILYGAIILLLAAAYTRLTD
jgi:ribose transport system ATP-binding protein